MTGEESLSVDSCAAREPAGPWRPLSLVQLGFPGRFSAFTDMRTRPCSFVSVKTATCQDGRCYTSPGMPNGSIVSSRRPRGAIGTNSSGAWLQRRGDRAHDQAVKRHLRPAAVVLFGLDGRASPHPGAWAKGGSCDFWRHSLRRFLSEAFAGVRRRSPPA
jgi:hypothetical protein